MLFKKVSLSLSFSFCLSRCNALAFPFFRPKAIKSIAAAAAAVTYKVWLLLVLAGQNNERSTENFFFRVAIIRGKRLSERGKRNLTQIRICGIKRKKKKPLSRRKNFFRPEKNEYFLCVSLCRCIFSLSQTPRCYHLTLPFLPSSPLPLPLPSWVDSTHAHSKRILYNVTTFSPQTETEKERKIGRRRSIL